MQASASFHLQCSRGALPKRRCGLKIRNAKRGSFFLTPSSVRRLFVAVFESTREDPSALLHLLHCSQCGATDQSAAERSRLLSFNESHECAEGARPIIKSIRNTRQNEAAPFLSKVLVNCQPSEKVEHRSDAL